MIDVLVGVWARTTIPSFVENEFLVIKVWPNVVIDSLIDVVADELTGALIGVCVDILVGVGLSDVNIIVVADAVIALNLPSLLENMLRFD